MARAGFPAYGGPRDGELVLGPARGVIALAGRAYYFERNRYIYGNGQRARDCECGAVIEVGPECPCRLCGARPRGER